MSQRTSLACVNRHLLIRLQIKGPTTIATPKGYNEKTSSVYLHLIIVQYWHGKNSRIIRIREHNYVFRRSYCLFHCGNCSFLPLYCPLMSSPYWWQYTLWCALIDHQFLIKKDNMILRLSLMEQKIWRENNEAKEWTHFSRRPPCSGGLDCVYLQQRLRLQQKQFLFPWVLKRPELRLPEQSGALFT